MRITLDIDDTQIKQALERGTKDIELQKRLFKHLNIENEVFRRNLNYALARYALRYIRENADAYCCSDDLKTEGTRCLL